MADHDREIEMLTPTTRSGRALAGGNGQKPVQQSLVGSPRVESNAVESQDLVAKKRRWLPLAAAATLGLVAALSMSGGPETVSSPDSDTSAETDDGEGVVDPVELDSPLVDGVDVGPESLELVAPIGEFVGVQDPVLSRYGLNGPAEYSVILASLSSDLRIIDLGTGTTSRLPGQHRLLLGTDELIVAYGQGATMLTEVSPPRSRDLPDDGQVDNVSVAAHVIETNLNPSFAAESPHEFWMSVNRSDGPVLQLRRMPGGEIVQEFPTPTLDWRFVGGIPIGEVDGSIYQLAPGSATGVRRVADAELVDADPGRALIRTCDASADRCEYQWLDRANWSPVGFPVPKPDRSGDDHRVWRIAGGGQWLVDDGSLGGVYSSAHSIRLINLSTGRRQSLLIDSENRGSGRAEISSNGDWLATSTGEELIIVNLITGEQFRSDLLSNKQVFGMIRTSPGLASDPTGTGSDVMTLPGFERDGEQALEAAGQSILATGWLGTGAVLDLATGESRRLDGLAEVKVVTDSVAIGLGPSNDLVSLSLVDGSRSSRSLGAVENLAILPGPDPHQVWLGSSGPGIMNLTSGLALLDTPNLELRERHDFRILTWHLGGVDPLGTSLGAIWRYAAGDGQLEKVRNGILVTASNEIALVWECADDRDANGEPPLDISHPRDEDGCAFVWRSTDTWDELDLVLPPNPSGVAGIYGRSRWLLTYASPTESQLVELETGRSISFGANWTDFLDVSPDGRWAIYRTSPDHLILSDLDSATHDSNGQAHHADLLTYESQANRKIASVMFLPTAE